MKQEGKVVIELMEDTQPNRGKLHSFLEEINGLYPVPLTEKVDLWEYTYKVFDRGHVLSALYDDKIIGVVIFYANNHIEKEAVASLIGVLPGYGQYMVGFRLAHRGIEIAKQLGMETSYTFTHKDNARALKFLQRIGFKIEPDRPTKYDYNVSLVRKL